MSIVDDLVENLVERNAVKLNGTLTISLVEGGLAVKGRDEKKGEDPLHVDIPVDAEVRVGDVVIPVPQIK
jgi:hypothetical protein